MTQFEKALGTFAVLSPTHMPLHFCQIFLVVTRRGQCTYQELMEELNLTNSAISRSVMAMGITNRKGMPGFDLLRTWPDPREGRRLLVGLTAKGKALNRSLESLA